MDQITFHATDQRNNCENFIKWNNRNRIPYRTGISFTYGSMSAVRYSGGQSMYKTVSRHEIISTVCKDGNISS
jgi:hypothetical protein